MMNPRSVAVIGATDRPGSVGAAVMGNLLGEGFAGSIIPVNPNHSRVSSLPAFPRIGDAPRPVDLAVVCTPASTVPTLVRECGEAGVGGLVIISAGFRETGPSGRELESRVRAELDRFPHMRVLGPNCLGLMVPSMGLNASFAQRGAKPGGVAFLSQSGALCTAILGWAQEEGIGFSHFVSVGNMVDIGFGDLLDYVADQAATTSVVLYIEAITDAPQFLAAARRCTARKPVIAYKAGRHPAAAKAAASHTGAMAGEDAVYQAAFDEAGIIRVDRLDDLLGTAELLGRGRWPRGQRLALVTNAGGPGVIATDALLSRGGQLANLSERTMTALDSLLPAHWSRANPVDVIGDAKSDRLATALDQVLQDPGVDAVVVIVTPQAMIDTAAAAWAVAGVASRQPKPVLAAWMVGAGDQEDLAALRFAGIPTYNTPEQAVGAFLYLAEYARRGTRIDADHAELTAGPSAEQDQTRFAAGQFLGARHGTLNEQDSKALLLTYGIPIARTIVATTREEVITATRALGYPVVLKVISPQVSHKTEVAGVALDLRTDESTGAAFDQIRRSLQGARPDAAFEGVTVQPMLDRSSGVELIIGVRRDATFGPVVLVGAGGTTAEVMGDRAIGLAPLSTDTARRLIDSLRIRPLLGKFRGRSALNIDAATEVMVRLSRMIVELPLVREAEANPILVTSSTATALDARVVLGDADDVRASEALGRASTFGGPTCREPGRSSLASTSRQVRA